MTLVMKIQPILVTRHRAPCLLDLYYTRCAYWCNYNMAVLWLDLRLAPWEGIHAWHCKPVEKSMAWEVEDPNGYLLLWFCQMDMLPNCLLNIYIYTLRLVQL